MQRTETPPTGKPRPCKDCTYVESVSITRDEGGASIDVTPTNAGRSTGNYDQMWTELKSTIPLEYQTHSVLMQMECHIVGAPFIMYGNMFQGTSKHTMNLETYRPDGTLMYYITTRMCNPGEYYPEIN